VALCGCESITPQGKRPGGGDHESNQLMALSPQTILKRSLEARTAKVELVRAWLERRKFRLDKLEEALRPADYEPRRIRAPKWEDLRGLHKTLGVEIRKLPRSQRRARRLRIDEAQEMARLMMRLFRRQCRLETKLFLQEERWRRYRGREDRATLLGAHYGALIENNHLDELETRLLSRRGTDGRNPHARALGKIARQVHPYSRERMAELGRLGGKRRWASRGENDNGEGDRGTTGETTGATGGAG
jgi:hypothetical protein